MKGPKPKSLAERLERLSEPCPMSGCRIFMGWLLPAGYGHIGRGGHGKGTLLAHRAAWLAYHGEIPKGMHVLHHCDVRCCVNPEHLFLGAHIDNMRDMDKKGRRITPDRKGSRNGAAKLTEKQAAEIRNSTDKTRILCERYGVKPTSIQHIRAGKTWKHV